jgi:hypothetical protein
MQMPHNQPINSSNWSLQLGWLETVLKDVKIILIIILKLAAILSHAVRVLLISPVRILPIESSPVLPIESSPRFTNRDQSAFYQ